jgi:hypothetical protein
VRPNGVPPRVERRAAITLTVRIDSPSLHTLALTSEALVSILCCRANQFIYNRNTVSGCRPIINTHHLRTSTKNGKKQHESEFESCRSLSAVKQLHDEVGSDLREAGTKKKATTLRRRKNVHSRR